MIESERVYPDEISPPLRPPLTEPEKKRRVNGKKKGSGFENGISKLLGEKLAPMKFRRSQSSGAILGGKNVKSLELFSEDARTLFIGDVVPTNEGDVARDLGWKLRFTIECKFYKDCDDLEHLLTPASRVIAWFKEAVIDSEKLTSKLPLLIFKYNRTRTFAAVHSDVPLPNGLTFTLELKPNGESPITIFELNESFNDLDWWKSVQSVPQPQTVIP